MSAESRRNFLTTAGKLLVSTVALGSIAGNAVAEHTHSQEGSEEGHASMTVMDGHSARCY